MKPGTPTPGVDISNIRANQPTKSSKPAIRGSASHSTNARAQFGPRGRQVAFDLVQRLQRRRSSATTARARPHSSAVWPLMPSVVRSGPSSLPLVGVGQRFAALLPTDSALRRRRGRVVAKHLRPADQPEPAAATNRGRLAWAMPGSGPRKVGQLIVRSARSPGPPSMASAVTEARRTPWQSAPRRPGPANRQTPRV